MNSLIKVGVSLLACDFAHLAEEAKKIEQAGADAIHIDIMDGHFVPNLSMGPKIVSAINRSTNLFLDVHLMMYNPFDYIERFIESGADMITIHFEAIEEVEYCLEYIRKSNVKAGLAFNPETPFSMIPQFLDKTDLALIMGVSPGYGGQVFKSETLNKIIMTRKACDVRNIREGGIQAKVGEKSLPPYDIQVDGGMNLQIAKECISAGANYLVSGSYLFGLPDMAKGIEDLKKI